MRATLASTVAWCAVCLGCGGSIERFETPRVCVDGFGCSGKVSGDMSAEENRRLRDAVTRVLLHLKQVCTDGDFEDAPTLLSDFGVVVIDSEAFVDSDEGPPRRRAGPIILPRSALRDPVGLELRLRQAVLLTAHEAHAAACGGTPP